MIPGAEYFENVLVFGVVSPDPAEDRCPVLQGVGFYGYLGPVKRDNFVLKIGKPEIFGFGHRCYYRIESECLIVNVSMARESEKNIFFGGPVVKTENSIGTASGGVIPIYRDAVGEAGMVDVSRPLLDGISTDGIIRVEDLLTDDLELLGKRALKGLHRQWP